MEESYNMHESEKKSIVINGLQKFRKKNSVYIKMQVNGRALFNKIDLWDMTYLLNKYIGTLK